MFLDLFYGLREAGVPVAMQEWQGFLRALALGLHGCSLLRFYQLGRACLIKSENYFDAYDRVFARVFKGVEGRFGDDVSEQILAWLRDPKNRPELTPEEWALHEDRGLREFQPLGSSTSAQRVVRQHIPRSGGTATPDHLGGRL